MVTSICLSSIQIFLVNLNGAAENGTGARVRAMLVRCYGPTGMKKRPDSRKLFERKTPIFTYRMTIFAPAARLGLFVDWAFFDGSEISSEFVGGQCASWRFPPKAAVSACSRHSFVEGIRNGGLDVLKTAAVLENPLWAHEAACPATVFFFPRLAGQDRLSYLV